MGKWQIRRKVISALENVQAVSVYDMVSIDTEIEIAKSPD